MGEAHCAAPEGHSHQAKKTCLRILKNKQKQLKTALKRVFLCRIFFKFTSGKFPPHCLFNYKANVQCCLRCLCMEK